VFRIDVSEHQPDGDVGRAVLGTLQRHLVFDNAEGVGSGGLIWEKRRSGLGMVLGVNVMGVVACASSRR
jgi:hypothetical protein